MTRVGLFSSNRAGSGRAVAFRLLQTTLLAGLVGCRPSSDVRPGDVRTYSVPRSALVATAAKAPEPRRSAALRYDLPEGWVDAGASGMRLATLRTAADTADPADVGEITIIPASGTLESNAIRWQEQLTPQADSGRVAGAIAAAEKVDVDGVESTILLLLDDAAENQQAILAAVIPVDDASSLFVKFKGPAELAHRLREPFTAFVRSIRWK